MQLHLEANGVNQSVEPTIQLKRRTLSNPDIRMV